MLYTFSWLIFSMLFALSTLNCTKKKKIDNNTTKSTPSRKSTPNKSLTSKSEAPKPLSQSGSDSNVPGGSRPVTPAGASAANTPIRRPTAAKKPEPSKYGKANATKTAEDEFKFPSLKETIASEHTDLDELDDEPNPLMDPVVQEKLRQRWAKNNKDPTTTMTTTTTVNTQATQYDDLATNGLTPVKGKSTIRAKRVRRSAKSDGPGFLSTVPSPQCPSVYVPVSIK